MRCLLSVLCFVLVCTAIVVPSASAERPEKSVMLEAIEKPEDESAFKAYLESLPSFENYYIVEGHLLMTEKQVRRYLSSLSTGSRPATGNPELIVALHNGKASYWLPKGIARLTYAVDKSSFPDDDKYNFAVESVAAAARDWEKACEDCSIKFEHLAQYDENPSHQDALFIVRYVDTGGKFIAAAFFPHYATQRRNLLIDKSLYTTSFDRVGVLRHELGHILGYRHEHTRDIPGCYYEDGNWLPLTDYDPHSVMHYYCGGGGTFDLQITEVDRNGHKDLYGTAE